SLGIRVGVFENRKLENKTHRGRSLIEAASSKTKRVAKPEQELIPVSPADLVER
ncbi:hypothetical protein KI387_014050, partial [Taxus chinensis]